MNFINKIKNNFETLSSVSTILFKAEFTTVITSIRCTNMTKDNIRITVEDERSLKLPIEKAYIAYELMVTPNQTIDMLMCIKGNSSELVEHTLLKGDTLKCYSNSYDEYFSCIISGYELLET